MNGRATFGEFLQAARKCTEPEGHGGRVTGRHDIVGVSHGLGHVVAAMSRYLDDVQASYPMLPSAKRSAESAWALAAAQAQEALSNAARLLPPQQGGGRPASPPGSELGQRLGATAVWLTAGRDLLQTHLAVAADGTRQQRSEWAAVITSPAATRALLMEMAVLARQIAPQVADLALSASASGPGTGQARRRLTAACQSLQALNSAVQTAHRQAPAPPAGRELLCAIPVNSLPPRRLPDGTESVAALCDGTVTTAERVRQLAWGQAARAAWSPEVSVASLHQVAAASTVTSHNCSVVLQTLTTGAAGRGPDRLQTDLAEAAEAANHAQQAWRRVAGALDQVVTDGRGHLSPVAVETRDLAIWTGQLAYAEPEQAPSSGPPREIRPPESLPPQQVPLVVAAVHHACHTLTRLAWAQEGVIRTAAQAGRILVTTRSLPDDLDIPHPYTQAPREHIDRLLSGYRIAGHASNRATIAVARVAQASGASSRVLAAAMATEPGRDRDETGRRARNSQTPAALKHRTLDSAGPVERTLLDLGVTRPDLLRRAADLDHDSERLIVDAAVDRELAGQWPHVAERHTSAATTALINHALASGDPRATALRQPYLREREPPEAEA